MKRALVRSGFTEMKYDTGRDLSAFFKEFELPVEGKKRLMSIPRSPWSGISDTGRSRPDMSCTCIVQRTSLPGWWK